MALATINSPFAAPGAPAPGTFDPTKIAQQMQTDPNVRTMFAQFFGDPASRQFVQDSEISRVPWRDRIIPGRRHADGGNAQHDESRRKLQSCRRTIR